MPTGTPLAKRDSRAIECYNDSNDRSVSPECAGGTLLRILWPAEGPDMSRKQGGFHGVRMRLDDFGKVLLAVPGHGSG